MTATTINRSLRAWVEDWVGVLQPDSVHWCDGSAGERDQLCQALVDAGMPRPSQASLAVAAFIDAINRGDLDGLAALISEEHQLVGPGEQPIHGRAESVEAWRRYFESFPDYLIFRRHMSVEGTRVAVLGTTTGSHLGMPPAEEMRIGVIWQAGVTDGLLTRWQLTEDTPELRTELDVPASA